MIKHKDYIGSFTFDEKTNLFQGKVSNVQYPLTFQGKSIKEMKQSFRDSIDEYLAWCKKYDKIPEKPSPIE
jgi:predicted HicB family RNase H-like nuclease